MEVKTVRRNVLGELNAATNNVNVRNSLKGLILSPKLCNSSVKKSYMKPPSFGDVPPKSASHLTNLELLTKVASGMRCDTDQDLILEYGDENQNFNVTQSREQSENNCKPRKEKSLSILCDKFLKFYPLSLKPGNYMEISLDQATQIIGTDRRRIYDILIVLECLQMASKVCKNHYQWHGTQHLEGTLSQLKWLAQKLGFCKNVNVADDNTLLNEDCEKECEASDLNVLDPVQMNIQTQKVLPNKVNISQSNSLSPGQEKCVTGVQNQKLDEDSDLDHKDNSLGVMCQKFLMLFLVETKVITLDNAAKVLLGASGVVKSCHKVKTKIRRLYDIANVLSSLELIKKVNVVARSASSCSSFVRSNRKPAFLYIGPQVQPKPLPDHAFVTPPTTRHSLLGHPLHAACEKKCSRKRKARLPCPLQPKLQNVNDESSDQTESSFIHKRSASFAFSSGMGSSRDKFPRSHSENCIGEGPKCHGSLRSDILQVAELELQRIFNEEQQEKEKETSSSVRDISSPINKSVSTGPKVNWRHHHSDNCISIGPGVSHASNSGVLKNSKEISWKNSILKSIDSRMNASSGANSLVKNDNTATVLTLQNGSNVRRDVSICIINRSNPVTKIAEGKFIPFSNKSAVPIVIHSVQKSTRLRSISINPVPISVSNCIMGPAYIIRQHPPGSGSNINPVSISLNKGDHVISSKEVLYVDNNSSTDIVPLKTY